MPGRVLNFTTDADGKVPEDVRLQRSTEYEAIVRTRPAASGTITPEWLASWLGGSLLGDVRTLRAGVKLYLGDECRRRLDRLGGGNFLLAAACFMVFEYAARIFTGDDNARKNFKIYAKEFLPFEPRYLQLADLLWPAFRNGIIHGAWPQAISRDDGTGEVVRVGVGVEPDDPHLAPDPREVGLTLVVNAVRLADDLERSITDGLVPWIHNATREELLRGAPRLLVLKQQDAGVAPFELIQEWCAKPGPG